MKRHLLFLFGLIISTSVLAVVPQGISHQAVIRDLENNLIVESPIGLQVSILHGAHDGDAVYVETHNVMTNKNGLISYVIGNGSVVEGVFQDIDWAGGPYWLETKADPDGGTNYTISGVTMFLSVPYALHAKSAAVAETVIGSVSNNIQPPTVLVLDADPVGEFSATINGIVNGEGFLTNVVFEWGTTPSYGNTVTAIPSTVTGSDDVQVSAVLSNLQAATTYHYRVKASNAVDIIYSEDMSFTTGSSVPQLTTNPITSITPFSSVSGGNITYDGGLPVNERGVVWSTESNPTIDDHEGITNDGVGEGSFTSELTDLSPGTLYYVRAYATNDVGTAYGNQRSFTTLGQSPTVLTQQATEITTESAVLNGSVNPNYLTATVTFQWGLTDEYGNEVFAEQSPVDGSDDVSVSAAIEGLSLGTTYHFRVVAENELGFGYGEDFTFTTLGQVPIAITQPATEITTESAVLNALVNPNHLETTVIFEWGLTDEYGNEVVAEQSPVDGSDDISVSAFIEGLESYTTYHLRVIAENEMGIQHGAQLFFTTLGASIFSTIFDEGANWDNPGGAWTNYNEKTYNEGDWFFHSTSAVRGNPEPFDETYGGSDYSFRDRDIFSVHNTAPVSGMSGFSMQLRDWMSGSGKDRNLKLSTDGGDTWETIIVINKAWFNEYQVYQEYIYLFPDGEMSFEAEQFMLELDGGFNDNTGRINIGQFVAFGTETSDPSAYNLNIEVHPEGAGTVYGEGEYEEGELVNVTATANEGWEFVNWTGDTFHIDDEDSAEAIVTIPADDVTLTAVFQEDDDPITPEGNIMLIHDITAEAGEIITIELEIINEDAFAGFQLAIPLPDGFTYIEGTAQLFRKTDHILMFNITDENIASLTAISLTHNPPFIGNEGVILSFDVQTPEVPGEYLLEIVEPLISDTNGEPVILTGIVDGTVTLLGDEPDPMYMLTLIANPEEGGTVSGGGEYNFADEVLIQATANEGWEFVNWTGDTQHLDDANSAEAIVIMPADDVTLTANFTMINYTLTLMANPEEGGTVEGAGIYNYQDEVVVNAIPTEGWVFTEWTGDVQYIDDISTASTTLTMPLKDIIITANFFNTMLPTVTTSEVTEITQTSATVGGEVIDDGGFEVLARGVCWSTEENPTIENSSNTEGDGIGVFSSTITDLFPGTTYYLRAYATNTQGTSYGEQQIFTTQVGLPGVVTLEATEITDTSAVTGGYVIYDGGSSVLARGVCWSTEENPTLSNDYLVEGDGLGEFINTLTGLTAQTTYYVRAFATNTQGVAYGNQISFVTLSEPSQPPTVKIISLNSGQPNFRKVDGEVTFDGGEEVTARGFVWDTEEEPTLEQNEGFSSDGDGLGEFTVYLEDLTPNTKYYIRAYATNSEGIAYSEQKFFNFWDYHSTVTDIDNNIYQTVLIGDQEWMAENLRVSRYRNGIPIPTGLSDSDWESTTQGAYAIYNNDDNMLEAYGKLYNWYAVGNSSGLCPVGWSVPSDDDWTQLVNYVVSQGFPNAWNNPNGAGNALKSCRQVGSPLEDCNTLEHPRWNSDETHHGFNEFGFSALPGGRRSHIGNYDGNGYEGYWWPSEEGAVIWDIYSFSSSIHLVFPITLPNAFGLSVRCIKD